MPYCKGNDVIICTVGAITVITDFASGDNQLICTQQGQNYTLAGVNTTDWRILLMNSGFGICSVLSAGCFFETDSSLKVPEVTFESQD